MYERTASLKGRFKCMSLNGGGVSSWHLVDGGLGHCWMFCNEQDSLPQRIIQPKTSVVLRLRNSRSTMTVLLLLKINMLNTISSTVNWHSLSNSLVFLLLFFLEFPSDYLYFSQGELYLFLGRKINQAVNPCCRKGNVASSLISPVEPWGHNQGPGHLEHLTITKGTVNSVCCGCLIILCI